MGGDDLGVFDRSAVLQIGGDPVARKVWQQILFDSPAAIVRRLIMRKASWRLSWLVVSRLVLPTAVRKSTVMAKFAFLECSRTFSGTTVWQFFWKSLSNGLMRPARLVSIRWVQSLHPGRNPKVDSSTLSYPAFEPLAKRHAFRWACSTELSLCRYPRGRSIGFVR